MVLKDVIIETIKPFLQDDQTGTNTLEDWGAWPRNSTNDGGDRNILAVDDSAKELLRNILLQLRELRELQQANEKFSLITLTPNLLAFAGGHVHNVCIWLQDGSTTSPGHFSSLENATSTGRLHDQSGILTIFEYVNDTHGRNYDTLVIRCSFLQPVGTDGCGGFLYLNMSHRVEPAYSELIPVFHERPGLMNATLFNLTTFQFEYVYCSAPIWTNLSAVHVKQWFMYHHMLLNRNVRYFVYDNTGTESETMAVLQPFIDAGILTVINQHRERDYSVWYHTQAPTINDCIRRARFLAKWVLFWDFDEYL
ncbi:hypothetical protein R1flu_020851 [Riccia fluitans]|uniref:Glycosyltransferase family 92 protein n=1 Tax=Riccia fluitans TaxID=41844 RepID=A0ABD1ZMP2_9MARC